MNLELSETQKLIRDTARSYAREKIAPGAKQRDREETFPAELLVELAGLGLHGRERPRGARRRGGGRGGVRAGDDGDRARRARRPSVAMAVTNMVRRGASRASAPTRSARATCRG